MPNIYFSDVFGIDEEIIEEYGAFNIALVNDLPLFVDPSLRMHRPVPRLTASRTGHIVAV